MLISPGQSFHLSFDGNVNIQCKLDFFAKDFIYSEIKPSYIFSVKIFVVLQMIVITDESGVLACGAALSVFIWQSQMLTILRPLLPPSPFPPPSFSSSLLLLLSLSTLYFLWASYQREFF